VVLFGDTIPAALTEWLNSVDEGSHEEVVLSQYVSRSAARDEIKGKPRSYLMVGLSPNHLLETTIGAGNS
jgi:hypothetical protein